MEQKTRSNLVFHAGVVILLGMLSGIPMSMVMMGEMSGSVNDWSISHMEGLINGILMLAVAAAGSLIFLSQKQERFFYWFVVITGYGNALYGWARGISGEDGMGDSATTAAVIVQVLGGLPVITAFGFVIMLMFGASKQSRLS